MHFKLCTTHSKFRETHSKFFQTHLKFTKNSEIFTAHFKLFTTHFKIFATHFEIFTTHSPQDPKCWQRKRNGYAAPPSSFYFFPRVESLCKFRSNFVLNAERILQITKKIKVRDETGGKKNLSFEEFKETKEKQRATFIW